ncbi:ATP-binding protein [Streptomyces sp. NPDC004609]|uniref:ATP-binding protein n=1 Tax=Streptomyces sp. NPDC004609 TaxID=3364704 RepID=UPI003677D268
MPTSLTNTALVYTCTPAPACAMASLRELTAETENELGYTVRATVADTAPPAIALADRAGWSEVVVPLVTAGRVGALVVASVGDLASEPFERASGMAWLDQHDVTVTALRPRAWEMRAWLELWSGTAPTGSEAPRRTARTRSRDRVCRFAFPADRQGIGPARAVIADRLLAWCPARADDAITAANELVANAVVHGSTQPDQSVTVTLERRGRELRISVADTSPRPLPPAPRDDSVSAEAESGRGLLIVDAFTDRWGCDLLPDGTGKQVWASMSLPASARCPRGTRSSLALSHGPDARAGPAHPAETA